MSSLSGANSIMTMKIARSANLTAQGVTGTSSQTEAFALSGWKQSTEYYSRTVMSSFLTSRASFQEKSNSRFVLSGRTKAFVLFPCLPFSLSLSLSLSNGPVMSMPHSLSFSLFRKGPWNRIRPGHSRYTLRVPIYTRCKYTQECIICLYTRCPKICV